MMLAFEGMERLDSNLEQRTIVIAEQHKADKATERLTRSGKRPISDQIEFGFGRIVAGWDDVVANILNPVCEKFTLLQLESDMVLHKDKAIAFKVRHRRVSKDVDHKRISSMMVLLPL